MQISRQFSACFFGAAYYVGYCIRNALLYVTVSFKMKLLILLSAEVTGLENTWNKDITLYELEKQKAFIESYISKKPRSVLISRYFDEFKSNYIYNTNAIEGNPVTEYDTEIILKSNAFLEGYTAKENMEILGSGKAWDYVLTKPEISQETVINIHRNILFFDVDHAGVFRKIPVHVGDKQMLPPEEVPEAMDTLFNSEKASVFETAAEIHLKFENIHPFVDGNGRTGRMIINLQLIEAGYLPVNIKRNDAGKYYRCFRQYDKSKEKGIHEMLNLITKYEYEELLKLRNLIETDMAE